MTDRTRKSLPAAFTKSETLKAFLDSRESGRWRLSLISQREEVLLAVADFHADGHELVCVDPDPDDSKCDSVKLVDLMDLADAHA